MLWCECVRRRIRPRRRRGLNRDRMPAIIPIPQHARWLSPEPDPRDLLRPYPARLMKLIPKIPKRK